MDVFLHESGSVQGKPSDAAGWNVPIRRRSLCSASLHACQGPRLHVSVSVNDHLVLDVFVHVLHNLLMSHSENSMTRKKAIDAVF